MKTLPVRVGEEADVDITSAARWYAQRSERVAIGFIDAVYRELAYITLFPNGAPRVRGNTRELVVKGFPFVILYRPLKDHIAVFRVFHTSQNPKKKFRRKK